MSTACSSQPRGNDAGCGRLPNRPVSVFESFPPRPTPPFLTCSHLVGLALPKDRVEVDLLHLPASRATLLYRAQLESMHPSPTSNGNPPPPILDQSVNVLSNRGFGGGEGVIEEFSHRDHAAAVTERMGQSYNIGTGTAHSVQELAEMIKTTAELQPRSAHTSGRAGDIEHSYANISRARQELGFEPDIGLKTGLEQIIGR